LAVPSKLFEFAANVHTIESPSGCVSSTHRLIQISNAEALRPNEARWSVLTQNVHSAPITQQAEKLSFARAERK
jgi:hypothetical protein